MVHRIQRFHAKLDVNRFSNVDCAEKTEVHIHETGSAKVVSSGISESLRLAGRDVDRRVCCRVEVFDVASNVPEYLDLRFDHIDKLRSELTTGAAGASALDDGD